MYAFLLTLSSAHTCTQNFLSKVEGTFSVFLFLSFVFKSYEEVLRLSIWKRMAVFEKDQRREDKL
jgi:hypothetical protein